jgi:hypothetical protein
MGDALVMGFIAYGVLIWTCELSYLIAMLTCVEDVVRMGLIEYQKTQEQMYW